MKRFGDKVKYFTIFPEDRKGEGTEDIKKRVFREIHDYVAQTGGQLYTGIHSSNNWGRLRWWLKGGHLVNRTGDFAVIIP